MIKLMWICQDNGKTQVCGTCLRKYEVPDHTIQLADMQLFISLGILLDSLKCSICKKPGTYFMDPSLIQLPIGVIE